MRIVLFQHYEEAHSLDKCAACKLVQVFVRHYDGIATGLCQHETASIYHVTQLDQSPHALSKSNYADTVMWLQHHIAALQLSSVIFGASNKHYIKELGAYTQCKAMLHQQFTVLCRMSGGAFLDWRYITEASTTSRVLQRSRASGRSIVLFWLTGGSQLGCPALLRVRW